MGYYLFIYIGVVLFAPFLGKQIWNRYKNPSGFFFFGFTVSASFWYILYFLFFSGIENPTILLYLSRSAFLMGLLGVYSLLFFIKHFSATHTYFPKKYIFYIFGVVLLLSGGFLFTDFFIQDIIRYSNDGMYREVYGPGYSVIVFLYLLFVVLFPYYSWRQIKLQSALNKIRLKQVLIATYGLLSTLIFLQLILPIWGIWVLEKEVIFIYLLFSIHVFHVLRRYYFSSIGYRIGRLAFGFVSFILSILILGGIRWMYGQDMSMSISGYWGFGFQNIFFDVGLGILLYQVIYRFFIYLFLGNEEKIFLEQSLLQLERNISNITRYDDMIPFLEKGLRKIFKTHFVELRIFPVESKNAIQNYFEQPLSDKIIINDLVFLEENKVHLHTDRILAELPREAFLILPLYDTNGGNIAILMIGMKPLRDFYTIMEIDVLRQFVFFLELHLKYIQTYEKIQDYSMNLDKKVDEKTMEYNDLINRQKEFISMISHEIKTPIAGAIFQADSILDDIDSGNITSEFLRSEVSGLNDQLIKTGELLSKLFSVQYYDTHSVTLFRERVQIARLLETECEIYAKMNEQIQFITRIDRSMGFIELDRIQFQQVIDNILQNAVKFACPKNPIIEVSASIQNEALIIIIEDNGQGFQNMDIQKIFDKYVTGGGVSSGLGMGLYLCKRIIEMHGGVIEASNAKGARFTITLPLYI